MYCLCLFSLDSYLLTLEPPPDHAPSPRPPLALQRLSYYTLIGAFLFSTLSYVVSGCDGHMAWTGILMLSFVAFERVSDSSASERPT